jgi:hypothetical protein
MTSAASATAAEVVPSCEGIYLQFCQSEDVEEVASECQWREEVEGWPGAVEIEPERVIPAVAICWEVVTTLRERERPQREREERRVREAQRRQREWAHKPGVTKPIAEEFARRLMRKTGFTNWSIDCDHGRINRITWSCKISIFYQCLRGRIQVRGAGFKDHRAYYRARGGRLRQCRA